MSDSTFPQTREALLSEIAAGRAELDATIAGLSDAELSAGSEPLDWSVKDHLAHLATWMLGVAALLNQEPRWRAMHLTNEFVEASTEDEMNEAIYHQHKDRTPADVIAFLNTSQQRLVDTIARLDYADLQKPYSHYQPDDDDKDDGRPIVWWIVNNSYRHYRQHIPWIKTKISSIRA